MNTREKVAQLRGLKAGFTQNPEGGALQQRDASEPPGNRYLRERHVHRRWKKVTENAFVAARFESNAPAGFCPMTPRLILSGIGSRMETETLLLKEANKEASESKELLQKMLNEVSELCHGIEPQLLEHVRAIRSARMSTVQEMREMLTILRDVRRFFLEGDYETEMARLERFVRLCREIQELKASGVFDAVCDASLRLAVPEGGTS